jgi:glucokinase
MSDATAIGIDVGGTQIRAARISAAGEVLAWTAQPTAAEPSLAVAQIRELLGSLDDSSVSAIGIGVPGRVDTESKRVLSGGYVDLAGFSPATVLADARARPIFIDNDGNMALVAEHKVGSARAAGTVVMFTIGTGIGGAIIEHGAVRRGRAVAGQLGHIAADWQGERCLCGRRGCVETTSSGTALRRHIAAAGLPNGTSAEDLLTRAADGDATAKRVLAAWAAPMRAAIDTAVAAFDPDLVVLGGGLGAAMHRALADFPAEAPWYDCALVPAALGDRAGVIGAGLSALGHATECARAPR